MFHCPCFKSFKRFFPYLSEKSYFFPNSITFHVTWIEAKLANVILIEMGRLR